MAEIESLLRSLLRGLVRKGGQGLVLSIGQPPRLFHPDGKVEHSGEAMKEKDVEALANRLVTAEDTEQLEAAGVCEILYEYDGHYFDCEIRRGAATTITFMVIDTELLEMSEDGAASASVTVEAPPEEPSTSGHTQPPWTIRPPVQGKEVVEPPRFEGLRGPDTRQGRRAVDSYLEWMVRNQATDMHLTPSFPPTLRIDNLFRISDLPPLSDDQLRAMILGILATDDRDEYEQKASVDLGYSLQGVGRFRLSCFNQQNGPSVSVRHIPEKVKNIQELGLPGNLGQLVEHRAGMLLFCGPTGSGKSTTQAALVRLINENQARHIITLEDPIEYIHRSENCLVQQREIGIHTPSFARGLRDALREDPDVIMVGELRDRETISMALAAAETGHLVLGTMHVNTTTNAITRLVDSFAEHERAGARAQLGESLRAVVNQRLLTHATGVGLVPLVELMKVTFAVAAVIRENKLHQLKQVLTTGLSEGMYTFERSAAHAYLAGKIARDEAERIVPDRNVFKQILGALRLQSARRVEKLAHTGAYSAHRPGRK